MVMSHTTGPWTVGPADWLISRGNGMGWRNFPVRAPDGFDVAMVYSDEDDAEQAANVHLIAAAPDLLAALRAVKAEFIDLYEECYPNDESDNDVTAAIDMAIAAIAKAEGRIDENRSDAHAIPTLTDAEREAITVACGDSSQWGRPHVATLMRLLERTK